jgi:hypothetical protein
MAADSALKNHLHCSFAACRLHAPRLSLDAFLLAQTGIGSNLRCSVLFRLDSTSVVDY